MAVVHGKLGIENELAAIRLQEAELQAQQDALFAERLAIAFSLGLNIEDEQSFDDAILQFGLDAPGADDLAQFANQLAELRATAGQLLAESLQEAISEQERASRDSEAVAAVLQAQERWQAQVAQHDAAFARRLESLDDYTWEQLGDQLQEPLDLPMPAGAPAAGAAAPSICALEAGATPRVSAQTLPQQCSTPRPTTQMGHQGAGPSRPPGASTSGAGAGLSVAGAGPSTQPAARPPRRTVNCLSCFDAFPETEVTCAGADAASSSTASAGCGHYFCNGCITEYVRGAVRERRFPVRCPMAGAAAGGGRQQGGCQLRFSSDSVLATLAGNPKGQQSYRLLEAESSLDPAQLMYCPHKACSSPLLLAEEDMPPPNQPATCPACGKGFCPTCRIPGWHQGYTCAAFQALPAHLRSAEDAAMLQLSERQQWKRCPACKLVVERSEGCNHMKCRCGCDFCYGCGKPYKDTSPTPDNAHGTPACGCPLFNVPAELEPQGGARAGAQGAAAAGPAQRPFRGGRFVTRTRCRHSASIYDCPQGPGRCWFWHDEDDEEE
ncbi:hypothetical protein PLESTF_000735500 [Pleodorina starrii]|nr:hypothetical protein PLESTM_001354800 [Pleodorina starrii]GLC68776.1 hypothetical protein PLESTF_000735500 [Pleodorina starrii]